MSPILAQAAAEIRLRLRSPATSLAILAVMAASYFWIPRPTGNATSVSWRLKDGLTYAPTFTAAYVGAACTMLSCVLVPFVGFYLVAGSVRRDRESGVGTLLSATPLSNLAYLAGKLVAHAAYLAVIAATALGIGLARFLWFGTGPFGLADFALPFAVIVPPAILFTAAMAVLFDVTPGLRGRAGLVVWFFTFASLLVAVPLELAGGEKVARTVPGPPVFDPGGILTTERLLVRSLPDAVPGSLSSGHVIHSKGFARVPWGGLRIPPAFVVARLASSLWALPPFLLALLFFDRFDPAKGRGGRAGALLGRMKRGRGVAAAEVASAPAPARAPSDLRPLTGTPSAARAIAAEALLLWQDAGWLRWPLVLAALATVVAPGVEGRTGACAAFFLLLIPVLSECGAREAAAGAGPLVFTQPGVPRSRTLWKAGAAGLFLLVAGGPLVVRAALASPALGLTVLSGLVFLAAAAASTGLLTGGGKLFSFTLLVLWYGAMNRVPAMDFVGLFAPSPSLVAASCYALAGAALIGLSMARERREA